jgi:hypothetical protein
MKFSNYFISLPAVFWRAQALLVLFSRVLIPIHRGKEHYKIDAVVNGGSGQVGFRPAYFGQA